MKKVNVLFRACDKVAAVNRAPRPFGLDKTSIVKLCFLSLFNAIRDYPHSISVIGDDLSDDLRAFFSALPVELLVRSMGNDGSIRECVRQAFALPENELVYFCEDDYIHVPQTFALIHECLDYLENLRNHKNAAQSKFLKRYPLGSKPLFIFPPDYPDRYPVANLDPSYILCTQHCHWRQVRNITFTFLTSVKCIKKYKAIFMKSALRARDHLLSRELFGRRGLLCLSPLPGLSTHFHEACMTPHVDWQALVRTLQKGQSSRVP